MKLTFTTLFKINQQNFLDSRFNVTRSQSKNYRWLRHRYLAPNLRTCSQHFRLAIPTSKLIFTSEYKFLTISSKSSCYFGRGSKVRNEARRHSPQVAYFKFTSMYSILSLHKAFYWDLYKHLNNTMVILQSPLLRWYLNCGFLTYSALTFTTSIRSPTSRYKLRFVQNKL